MIRIYGKRDCPKCDAAKEKLKLLGMAFTFHDITDSFPGWRDTLATTARAHYEDTVDASPAIALPTVEIDGVLFTYPAAMKKLKQT